MQIWIWGGIEMPNKNLYRIKKEFIKEIPKVMNSEYPFEAFKEGYLFVKEKESDYVYMINTTTTKKSLKVQLVNVEIVGE